MKTKVLKKTILHVCVLALLNTVFFSCTYPYFNQPQPVATKNLKKVPRELWGAWIYEKDSIIIDKYSFTHVVNSFDQSEISKSEMELSDDYQFVNGKIFYVGGVMSYHAACDYVLKNDTFNLTGRTVNQFNLSDSVLLRKTGKLYVFNIQRGNWWEILVLGKEKNGEITIYAVNAETLRDDMERFHVQSDSSYVLKKQVNNDQDSIICFNAAFNKRFFNENIVNEELFLPIFILSPDGTFKDELDPDI